MVEFKSDVEEPLVETLQLAAGVLIRKLAAVHFQEMTCCCQRAADARKIRAGEERVVGLREFGNEVKAGSVLAGDVKLTLQVLLSDFEIPQGHLDIFVPHQLHECR